MSRDWLYEYAVAGADAAAHSLARLVEGSVMSETSACEKLEMRSLPEKLFPGDTGALGVFVDLVGAIQGEAGIALRRPFADALVLALVPDADVENFDTRAQSALSEIGNIALSSASGAIADMIGGVVIPSVPRLGATLSDALLVDEICSELRNLPVYLASCDITRGGEPFPMNFVWIPGDPGN